MCGLFRDQFLRQDLAHNRNLYRVGSREGGGHSVSTKVFFLTFLWKCFKIVCLTKIDNRFSKNVYLQTFLKKGQSWCIIVQEFVGGQGEKVCFWGYLELLPANFDGKWTKISLGLWEKNFFLCILIFFWQYHLCMLSVDSHIEHRPLAQSTSRLTS